MVDEKNLSHRLGERIRFLFDDFARRRGRDGFIDANSKKDPHEHGFAQRHPIAADVG